jgi:hypothetical protein
MAGLLNDNRIPRFVCRWNRKRPQIGSFDFLSLRLGGDSLKVIESAKKRPFEFANPFRAGKVADGVDNFGMPGLKEARSRPAQDRHPRKFGRES